MKPAGVLILAVIIAGCAESAAPPEGQDSFSTELDDKLVATDTTGVIRGIVVDPAVVPVIDARIEIKSIGRETFSNEVGAFGFADIDPGTYFLEVSKPGYNTTQTSAPVVAGVDKPEIIKIQIIPDPSTAPYVESTTLAGHLACGAAVFYTSVGCTINGALAGLTDSQAIWSLDFDRLFNWTQGELVWQNTQPAAGAFIWQIVQSEYPGSPQPHIGYMETKASPALAYLDQATIDEYADWILTRGIDYRFFGGPHDLCPQHVGDPSVNRFGCGLTLDQTADAFVHHFYNFVPEEDWRFTRDGPPTIPR